MSVAPILDEYDNYHHHISAITVSSVSSPLSVNKRVAARISSAEAKAKARQKREKESEKHSHSSMNSEEMMTRLLQIREREESIDHHLHPR